MEHNEIIQNDLINTTRAALHKKYDQDMQLKEYLEQLQADSHVSPLEKKIINYAYDEVENRLYYVNMLDNLWGKITEIQDILVTLHVYNSLEKEEIIENDESSVEVEESKDAEFTDIEVVQASLTDCDEEDSMELSEEVKEKKKKDKKKKDKKDKKDKKKKKKKKKIF